MLDQTVLLLGLFKQLDTDDYRVLATITLFGVAFFVIRKLVFLLGKYISRDK